MSGLTAEMTQSTRDVGTQWILDLCNGIVKEGCISEDWKSGMVLPIYKGKRIQWIRLMAFVHNYQGKPVPER